MKIINKIKKMKKNNNKISLKILLNLRNRKLRKI